MKVIENRFEIKFFYACVESVTRRENGDACSLFEKKVFNVKPEKLVLIYLE